MVSEGDTVVGTSSKATGRTFIMISKRFSRNNRVTPSYTLVFDQSSSWGSSFSFTFGDLFSRARRVDEAVSTSPSVHTLRTVYRIEDPIMKIGKP